MEPCHHLRRGTAGRQGYDPVLALRTTHLAKLHGPGRPKLGTHLHVREESDSLFLRAPATR